MLRTIILLTSCLLCATELRAEQTTSYGYHLHSWSETGFTRFIQFMDKLKQTGGTAGRIDTSWQNFQSKPKTAFNPNSSKLKPAQYLRYLADRGYGQNGGNLFEAYKDLHDAHLLGLKSVFNFGVIPEWARQPASNFTTWTSGQKGEFTYHPTPEQISRLAENSLANPDYVGQFFADLIIYMSKQPDGIATLQSMGGWEVFNEVGTIYGNGTPPIIGSNDPADAWTQLPYKEYLSMIDDALARVHSAYVSIGLKLGPPIIAPPVGGTYNPSFWQAIADYKPKHTSTTNASGLLALDQIGLHPYGMTVQAWLEPYTTYHKQLEDGTNDVRGNMTYGRVLMPTDDRFTWDTLVGRAPATPFKDRIFNYASRKNNADQYFDTSTELGVTRTMARFAQMGYGKMSVNFSEWGASSYVGDPTKADFFTQLNTTFADPFKYGEVPLGQTLPQEMAENTQAETLVQTLGLMRSWDFVNTATVYEMFEQPAEGAVQSDQYQYGLALSKLKEDGNPNWKPAGLAYIAVMRGREYHNVRPEGQKGVDIHISAASGTLDETQINPNAHNLFLFDDKQNHTIATGVGDDIIFGGGGDDFISGGPGHNRLYGGFGNDIIVGGNENDKINGGVGDDLLTGGGGRNEYVFSAYSDSGSGFDGSDTIIDFKPSDLLQIVGGYRFEKLKMSNTSEGGVKGVKINYAANGASIFLQGFTQENLKPENFQIFKVDEQSAQMQ
jgi:hypothetical protein